MTVGVRPDDLRRRNRAMVIGAVRRLDQPSRTEIAAITGLSHSTISAIASALIVEGVLLEERAAAAGDARRGRPQVGLTLNPGAARIVTVVLRFNAVASALVDYRGETAREDRRRIATTSMDGDALVAAIVASIERLEVDEPLARIALTIQGTTDAAARAMLWSPVTGATDIPFADQIEARFGVPATVENDCNMLAEALRWRDPSLYRDNFVALLLSDGIGMGLVHKGQLLTGTHSSGGEFGHMVLVPDGALCRCGRRGCVEAYAGNYAIWRSAHGLAGDTPPDADRGSADMVPLVDAARAGDGPARAAFSAAGAAVGTALGSLFALVDAAPVAIVGTGAAAFDLIDRPLREALARTAGGQHSRPVDFATHPEELPLMREGSAMRALTYIDQRIAGGELPGLTAQRAGDQGSGG